MSSGAMASCWRPSESPVWVLSSSSTRPLYATMVSCNIEGGCWGAASPLNAGDAPCCRLLHSRWAHQQHLSVDHRRGGSWVRSRVRNLGPLLKQTMGFRKGGAASWDPPSPLKVGPDSPSSSAPAEEMWERWSAAVPSTLDLRARGEGWGQHRGTPKLRDAPITR